MPTKAMWPKLISPEWPMKMNMPTTITTRISTSVTVRCRLADPASDRAAISARARHSSTGVSRRWRSRKFFMAGRGKIGGGGQTRRRRGGRGGKAGGGGGGREEEPGGAPRKRGDDEKKNEGVTEGAGVERQPGLECRADKTD